MKARTVQGRVVRVGDRLTTPGERDSRFKHVVTCVDDDGYVQFEDDPHHRYTTDTMRHVHDDEE